jgi:hypothetical protein
MFNDAEIGGFVIEGLDFLFQPEREGVPRWMMMKK